MPSLSPDLGHLNGQGTGPTGDSQPKALRRWEAATFALVVAGAAALRLFNMNAPVWLDEAWVANSVLEPTLQETLFFDHWLQTTPPLLLVLLRWTVGVLGTSEVALRTVPWLGGVGAVACFAAMARKAFSWPLALGGTTLLAANLYAARQANQIKQYSTDLLVACLFLWCLWRLHKTGGTKEYVWLLILGSAGVFLSYPALFWLPAALLAIAMQTRPWEKAARGDWRGWLARQWPLLVACMVYGLAFVFVYLWFIAPNQTPDLVTSWGDKHLGSAGKGLGDVLANISPDGCSAGITPGIHPAHDWGVAGGGCVAGRVPGVAWDRARALGVGGRRRADRVGLDGERGAEVSINSVSATRAVDAAVHQRVDGLRRGTRVATLAGLGGSAQGVVGGKCADARGVHDVDGRTGVGGESPAASGG